MSEVDEKHDEMGNIISYLDLAKSLLGEPSRFNFMDVCSDADAIHLANDLNNPTSTTHPVSAAINNYYSNSAELRINNYLSDINANLDLTNLKAAISSKMSGAFENLVLVPLLGTLPSISSRTACCEAFAQYIIDNQPII